MSYSSQIQTLFSGPSDTNTYPPDSGLAIGPNYAVMIEGSQIEWTNLTGGSPTVQSVYSFFAPLSPTGGFFDQRVVYDSVNQRFVAIMEYLAPDGTTTDMDIAVSKDSNPNDGWTFSQLNTTVTINGQSTDSDRPTLAVDGSNVYISAAQYNINVSGYAGTENWIIGDTAGAGGGIYGGGTLSVTASEVMPSTQGIFAVASGTNGKTYYASDYSSGGQIVVALQTYDKATNTFSTTSTIALGNIDQGGSYTAQQQGTSLLLDAADKRIASMVYANGYLYAVAEMKPIGSSVPLVHWFKIDVSNPNAPSLVAQGDISGAAIGASVATFNPSIAVDTAGDVLINFTASGPNMYPADYYVFQGGSDPVGSFSAPILYQASTSFFNSGDGNSTQRWGANSSATVDPNNPNSFWISNEYVANGWWQTAVARIAIQGSAATPPTVSSIAASGTGITSGAGDLNAGKLVTLTVTFSAAVTVNTTGGAPTLALNDGGTASYTGGSGSTALTFSYTVAAGQNTADLVISALNLNGAVINDGAGNAANLSGAANYNSAGILQIDTTAPTIASIVATGTGITNGSGTVSTGQVVTLTVNLSEAVTVNTSGGTPTLTLNDGGTATYTGGTGSTALTFSYTVAAGQTTSDLAISALNLNGAVISDGAGNAANLAGASNYNPAGILQVNTTAPTIASIAASGTGITSGSGDLNAGQVVTLTVNFSAAVTVNTTGGAPTLTLNDGGTASYTGGSGGTALTFSYTVAAGQNTADLAISSFNLNGAAIADASGNAANLSGATNYNPAGTLQIDTTAPTIASIVATGTGITNGSGSVSTGQVVSLTVNLSEAVTVNTSGGTPTLTLNDGGTASYTSGTGSSALIFSYTVAAGQTTSDLTISTLNLNGAAISDGAGNAANLAGATNYNPTGTLQVNPSTTATSRIQTLFSGPSTTSNYPPHNGLAVGPNFVVMIEGSLIEWTNLAGGSPTQQSVYSFFAPLSPTGGLFDQRIAYDSVNQRFVAMMEYLAPDGTTTDMDIAVSKDSNPNDGWTFSQLNTTITINGQSTDSDRPALAVDGSNVYISAPQYNIKVSGYAGTENWVISDTAGAGGGLYGGGTLSVTKSEAMPSTQRIFTVAAGNNGKTYYASDFSSGGQIVVALQTYDKATNTFSATSTIALGNIDQGGSYTVQQQGTSLLLDAVDNRITSMVYANGYLYAVAEMRPSGSSVPLVHWLKIDVSNPNTPSLLAQGDISGASLGTNVGTFNPSIAVDAAGDVIINFTASGPNLYPSDYYVFQSGSSAAGSFSAPILYKASTGFFNSGDRSSVQRWGLNSSAIVDPNNPNSFWISNEYVANGWWQTSVAQIAIQNSTGTGPAIASIAASGTGITNGSGDLNAGKVVALAVNFSAAVTVNTSGGSPTLALNDGGFASYTGGSGSTALTFSYTVAAGQNAADLVVSALNLNGATVTDGSGNAANLSGATNYNPAGTLQIDTTAPTIASIVATGTGITNGSGNVSTGQVVTLTVNLSEAVTVNTSGGMPTLALNDGGTATYSGGSGSTALTFSYTVAAGQTTSDLAISSFNLNGAVVSDGAGNATNLSGATNYNPSGTLQVNSTATTVASIAASGTGITSGTGDLNAGKLVTLTVNFSAAVTVNTTGGAPTLTLNDGGAASYTGGSGSTALTFSYTVAAGQNAADLIVSALNLNGGTITGGNGNAANLTGATNYNPAGILQIDTTAPTIASIVATGTGITNGSGSVSTGQVVTLTVNLSEAVTVNTSGGTPTLALNDGGTASYASGSGSTALTFSYTVVAGQTTSDLAISSFNLNGAVVNDGAGNVANLTGATNYNPTGTLQVNSTTTTTGVPKYSHIVVVVEENHNYDQIAGNSQAPYINSLMAGGASLTNMTAEAHPSQPNYFTLYAGSTFGTTDDNSYSLPDPTLYTVLKNGGFSFTGYVDEGGLGSDFNHDPWVSFPEGRTVQTDFTSFPALFANGNYSSLPTVSFVIPSVSNDMHNGTIAQGDTWLQQNLGAYAQWAVNNNSLLIVTWDENDDSTSEAASNKVPTLLYGANVVPGNYSTAYDHYNLLSTITNSLGLTAPNNAATAAPIQVFGTAAQAAALTVDQDGVAESPALTIGGTSLTVQAGGSVPLGITATPVDSDDQLSLSISGLPSYESITAPAGNTVTSSLQSNGTYTWTITEGSSTTGQPLTGLTLSSSYTGTDHPVATFTVTASNTTSGEAATSASQTMTVTDPPAPSPSGPNGLSQDAGSIDRLAALMDQFAAAGFGGNSFGPSPSTPHPIMGGIGGDPAFLAAAHCHTG
ncbi:alkaline phosphatase family protein [Bradyrhizobium sp. WSM3983]|uniref:alkaline phosphatase family protein n=1 Tax=Bradyrhizobium sp. WSM3983 TaxID=1038867 RepID=UPI00042549D0|nr:alkaline phosphatase family protein [Bradyrhizobium sp. WSM3983]